MLFVVSVETMSTMPPVQVYTPLNIKFTVPIYIQVIRQEELHMRDRNLFIQKD